MPVGQNYSIDPGQVQVAIDTPNPVMQNPGNGTGDVQDGVRGGGTTGQVQQARAVTPTAAPNPTLDLIAQFGDAVVQTQIKKARTAAMVNGMQKAMAGEAIQDIAAEQPWYSKIFGDSDAVEGARQFLGNTRAQSASISMVDDMPNLRKLDGPDAQSYFNQMVQKSLTGDPAADAAIMNGFERTLPTIMKQQAKENFAYKQERANAAQSASFSAGAANVQKLGSMTDDDIFTQNDLNAAKSNWIASIMPAQGQDVKSWMDARMDDIINAAKSGNFHAVSALAAPITNPEDGTTQSFLDMFKPDQRAQIDQAIERGAQQQRLHYSQDWSTQLSQLESLAMHPETEGVGAQDVIDQATALNTKYKQQTGSPLDLIDPKTVAQYGRQAQGAIIEERMREARQLEANNRASQTVKDKAAAAQAKLDMIDQTFAGPGDLYALATEQGYGKEAIDSQVLKTSNALYAQGKGDQVQSMLWNNFSKGMYVVKPIADQLDGAVVSSIGNDKGPTNGFLSAYAKWKSFNNVSPDFAAAYFPKTGARMAQYDQAMTNSSPNAGAQGQAPLNTEAFTSAFGAGFKNGDISDKDGKAAMKAVVQNFPTTLNNISFGWLGGTTLNDDEAARLANKVAVGARPYVASQGLQGAMQRALAVELASGRTTVVGSHVISDQNPASVNLTGYFSKTGPNGQTAIPTGEGFGSVFDDAVKSVLATHTETQADGTVKRVTGVLPDMPTGIYIGRAPDLKDGTPSLLISAPDGKGGVVHAVLNGNDIYSAAQRYRDAKTGDALRQAEINARISAHVR